MERVCFLMRVEPEQLDEYIARHRSVWPEMLEALRDTGWRNYSLFADDSGMIIGYLETENFAAAQAEMEHTAINSAWQKSMSPLFAVGGSFDDSPTRLTEIFNLEDQLAAITTDTEHSERTTTRP
ncbi:L-rhamnose mutarotase [Brevibacterium ammoniilyticum]|uniref:L-rhamnose mutarotase n=1 Tax=Brevibacterium ammoniilyticum TaxID=1046555 RepID=A0ABP9U341_9MICO